MVFRTGDWSQLTSAVAKSHALFFGRKFEAALDQSVMNRLEERFIANASLSFPGWDSYWENAFHSADLTPQPDPTLLAAASSLARHVLSLLTHLEPQESESRVRNASPCALPRQPGKIVSITSYFRLDHHQGDLILFDVGSEGVQFEALVKPLSKTWLIQNLVTGGPSRVVSVLQVGSDYDPKERVMRNRLGVLTPNSKVVAAYKWTQQANNNHTETNSSAQLVWFDPMDRVRFVGPVNCSQAAKVSSHSEV